MENIQKINDDEFIVETTKTIIKLSELETELEATLLDNIERQAHIEWVATLPEDKQQFVHVDPLYPTEHLEELIQQLKNIE